MGGSDASDSIGLSSGSSSGSAKSPQVPPTAVADFARKLYVMLEDLSIESLVSWGPQRDRFIVKDVDEFSNYVLPRIFNHSNFASFIRQLNKYGFHKLKRVQHEPGEKEVCVFTHQHFHRDRPNDLQLIKRKTAPSKYSSCTYDRSSSPSPASMGIVVGLREAKEHLGERIRDLENNNEVLQAQLGRMKRGMEQTDIDMQALTKRFGSMNRERNISQDLPNQTSGLETNEMQTRSTVESAQSLATSTELHGTSFSANMHIERQSFTYPTPPKTFAIENSSQVTITTQVSAAMSIDIHGGRLSIARPLPLYGWTRASVDQVLPGMELCQRSQDVERNFHHANSSYNPALFHSQVVNVDLGIGAPDATDISAGFDRQPVFRRQSHGHSEAQPLGVVGATRQMPGARRIQSSIGSFDEDVGTNVVHAIDGRNLKRHKIDRGEYGVSRQMDIQPVPYLAASAKTNGSWSFDTSAIARHGMLDGLRIAVGGGQPPICALDFVPSDSKNFNSNTLFTDQDWDNCANAMQETE